MRFAGTLVVLLNLIVRQAGLCYISSAWTGIHMLHHQQCANIDKTVREKTGILHLKAAAHAFYACCGRTFAVSNGAYLQSQSTWQYMRIWHPLVRSRVRSLVALLAAFVLPSELPQNIVECKPRIVKQLSSKPQLSPN